MLAATTLAPGGGAWRGTTTQPPRAERLTTTSIGEQYTSTLCLKASTRRSMRAAREKADPISSQNPTGRAAEILFAIRLALSGGGIRSAAFCLGALQALESASAVVSSRDRFGRRIALFCNVRFVRLCLVCIGAKRELAAPLYRDRLSNAFLFTRKRPEDGGPNPVTAISYLRLSRLNHKFSPYHLINSALNIQKSRHANQRGRDADFFLFSANYVGSDSTGYIETKDIEPFAMRRCRSIA